MGFELDVFEAKAPPDREDTALTGMKTKLPATSSIATAKTPSWI